MSHTGSRKFGIVTPAGYATNLVLVVAYNPPESKAKALTNAFSHIVQNHDTNSPRPNLLHKDKRKLASGCRAPQIVGPAGVSGAQGPIIGGQVFCRLFPPPENVLALAGMHRRRMPSCLSLPALRAPKFVRRGCRQRFGDWRPGNDPSKETAQSLDAPPSNLDRTEFGGTCPF